MPSTYQIAKVSCTGGLDLRRNSQELLGSPGLATRLENFEQSISGGYRRINGYSEIKSNDLIPVSVPVPGEGEILGVSIYNNGYVVCRGDNVYFSFADNIEWLQVNRLSPLQDGEPQSEEYALFSTRVEESRTSAGTYSFNEYTHGAGEVDLIIRDPNNSMAVLTIVGTDRDTATFSYNLITSGDIPSAAFGEIVRDQHVASGNPLAPSEIYVSSIADVDDFTGTSSQQISVADPVVGIKLFRDNLYIFCETSIWRAANLENPAQTQVQNVTRNVGCVSSGSIQEIGGDLIFLSHDGFRTLAGTDRIDDVNLSTVSLDIDGEVLRIIRNLPSFSVRSVVLKERSQYRMFYSIPPSVQVVPKDRQLGVIATFYPDPQTGKTWSYSQTKSIEVSAVATGYHRGLQVSIHGDFSGKVYLHDVGSTFDGQEVKALYETPYFDFGDPGLRKNLRELVVYVLPEGSVDLLFDVNYDYNNANITHQPLPYPISRIRAASRYSQARYGEAQAYTYGDILIPIRLLHIQGSGMTSSFVFETSGQSDPFTIQGYDINFTASGRI